MLLCFTEQFSPVMTLPLVFFMDVRLKYMHVLVWGGFLLTFISKVSLFLMLTAGAKDIVHYWN